MGEMEREKGERVSRLVEIAEETFRKGKVEAPPGTKFIHVRPVPNNKDLSEPLRVNLTSNSIDVPSKLHLRYAVRLAKVYVSREESGFVIRKKYSEVG